MRNKTPEELVFEMKKDAEFEGLISRLLLHLEPRPRDVEAHRPLDVREGLAETPRRVCKAWNKWTEGYHADLSSIFTAFEDGAEKYDALIYERGIPFYSHCEHHLAPFFGTVLIGYVPDGKIVGLSKLSRLVDIFAHRLQVQERLTQQIAEAMMEHLKPKGVGVHILARHMCMESRGICKQGIETGTTVLRGCLYEDPDARAEFLQLRHA